MAAKDQTKLTSGAQVGPSTGLRKRDKARAAYDALRNERVQERKTAFLEMMSALSGGAPVTDRSWDHAVMSLRGGVPEDEAP
jgi:hypothetical protein